LSARMLPAEVRLEPLLAPSLDMVMRTEQMAYAHPWSRTNFLDALHSGYTAQMLMAHDELIGYFVAMQGVEEVHLLNLTVDPAYQGQGWARMLLDALALWARGRGAQWLWLEVRVSNARALHVYENFGLRRVGERKNYYPHGNGLREDAIVMSMQIR